MRDGAVDVGLRPDVDAVRRLVEDQYARLGREPFREHDLLLVAAGEAANDLRRRRRLDPQLIHEAPRQRALGARPQDSRGRELGKHRQRGVRGDRHRLHEPLAEPVFREVREPAPERGAR